MGARPLRRTIQRDIEDQLSERILFGQIIENTPKNPSKSFSLLANALPIGIPAEGLGSGILQLEIGILQADWTNRRRILFSIPSEKSDLGNLSEFPFMLHKGDEAEPAPGGESTEQINIASLNDIDTAHVCVLNYSKAIDGRRSKLCTGLR